MTNKQYRGLLDKSVVMVYRLLEETPTLCTSATMQRRIEDYLEMNGINVHINPKGIHKDTKEMVRIAFTLLVYKHCRDKEIETIEKFIARVEEFSPQGHKMIVRVAGSLFS